MAITTGIPYWTFPSFSIGPLTIRTFGLFVALGVLAGIYIAARRNERFGIPRSQTEKVALILVAVGFVGARLLYVATHWKQMASPLEVFAVWDGGLQFSGGIIAALIVAPFLLRRWPRDKRWDTLDSVAIGFAVGQFIGRFGCYSVGEHLGGPTDFFLGVTYKGGVAIEGPLTVGVTYNSAALYEILWLIPLIVILIIEDRRVVPPGVIAATFGLYYGIARFLTDFTRTHDKTVLHLTGAQYMCIALVAASAWLLWYSLTRLRKAPEAQTPPVAGAPSTASTPSTPE